MSDKNTIFKSVAIGLGAAVIALVILLVYRGNQAAVQIEQGQAHVTTFSNQWQQVTADLEQQKTLITNLETDLTLRKTDIVTLSNTLTKTAAALTEIESSLKTANTELKTAKEEITKRDETIAKLEGHQAAMEQEANNLNATIATLNSQIVEASAKLVAAEGDKAALTKEIKRLLHDKAELERKFNDITALKAQINKIRTELNIARRLDRASEGLPASSELKGGQQQIRGLVTPAPRPRRYDLNVEVNSDGSVKVIPPLDSKAVKPK